MFLLQREPQMLVEGQCVGVRLLGVDEHHPASTAPEPQQGIDDQRGADATSGVVGVHGKALKVADVEGAAADGVAEYRRVLGDPEPYRRGGVQGLVEPVGTEVPEGFERQAVDLEHGRPIAPTSSPETVIGGGKVPTQVVSEDVEALPQLESGGVEHVGIVGAEGGCDGTSVAVVGQLIETTLDGGATREHGRRGRDGDVGERRIVVPRTDDEPVLANDE